MSVQRPTHSVAYRRFRRRLLTGLVLMAILATTLVISQLRNAYTERIAAAHQQTEHYVKAIEAHVLYSIQFIDLSLLGFANAIKVLPGAQTNTSATIASLLSSRRTTYTTDYWIMFIDADGNAVATSNNLQVRSKSYAHRDYFLVHANNAVQDHLYIGEPDYDPVSRQDLFYLSRRVENAQGKFLGVIVAPLNAARYGKVFENSQFTPDVSIALIHGSGKVIARAPDFDAAFGRDLSQTSLFRRARTQKAGTYAAVSTLDGVSRIYSYRILDDYPLLVVVGSSDAQAARTMQKSMMIAGAGLALLLLLMLTGGHFSLRTYRRQEERENRYRQLYTVSVETEQKLGASEQRLRLIADNLPVMIAYLDRDHRYTFSNRRFEQEFHGDDKFSPGLPPIAMLGHDIDHDTQPYLQRAFLGEQVHFEHQVQTRRGKRWHGVSYVPDKTTDDSTIGLFLMVEDITERKKNEESLQLTALLYQNSSQGMMVTDAEGRIMTVNPAFSRLSGYAEYEVVGRHAYELTSGREDLTFYHRMRDAISHNGQWEGEIWHQHKNGEQFLAWLRFNTVYDKNGRPYRYVALLSDITKKKASEELIWKQANFDTLTGLPNRRLFHEHLRQEMKKTDRSHLPMALVFIDLDYFKEVNDTMGHDKGDMLLKEVAVRLSQCVRNTDIVARLGGDEFTVILSELRNAADVLRIAQHILKKLSTPFILADDVAHISSSIGITLYPDDGPNVEALMNNADQAMYAAKQQGRNRFNYFAPFMQEATRVRVALGNELREAVSRHQLRLLFQPIVELASGRICKAEALVRWEHPTRGLLNPAEFIAIAETTGMIVGIGDWVFQHAAREAKRLQQLGLADFQICVNKSAWQFRNDGSDYQQWLQFLDAIALDPHSIVIEVTESLLLEQSQTVAERLQAFQHAQMQISLDDFGTGYASVAFLKRYDIDYIKIDPTFVRNLAEGTDGIILCEAIIAMAHKLGIKVIAEGIETEQQMQALRRAGCDFGQGYLFSRPISSEALAEQALLGDVPVDNSLDIHSTTCE